MTVQFSRLRRLAAALAVLLLMAASAPSASARGSFGGGGRSFGSGGRSFGGGSFGGGGRSFGGGGFGGLFGRSRPAFTPPPRPAFTPAPAFAPRPTFAPGPPSPPGSFGRSGGIGSPVSNRFSATPGGGGSFGRTGTAGGRTFSSIGSHPQAAPPVTTQYFGRPVQSGFAHPYYYGGRPANVYFTGGYPDYSFGYYRHPYLGFFPWSPVFFYNPPIYTGGGYVSGGFSFVRFLIGVVFWGVVVALIVAVFRHLGRRRTW